MTSKKQTTRMGSRAAREQEMQRLVCDQERSGLSQRLFCQRHGIALSTLTWWRRKLGRGVGKARRRSRRDSGGFFEVQLIDDTAVVAADSTAERPIEICLPSGAVIRVPQEASDATLRRVISVVGTSC